MWCRRNPSRKGNFPDGVALKFCPVTGRWVKRFLRPEAERVIPRREYGCPSYGGTEAGCQTLTPMSPGGERRYHSAMGNAAWIADPTSGKYGGPEAAIVCNVFWTAGSAGDSGRRARGKQKLLWPRTGAFDEDGYELDGIPDRCVSVCKRPRAFQVGPSAGSERGGQVVQETSGPISTSYARGLRREHGSRLSRGCCPVLVEAGIRPSGVKEELNGSGGHANKAAASLRKVVST